MNKKLWDTAVSTVLSGWAGQGWYLTAHDENELTVDVDWYENATDLTYQLYAVADSAYDPDTAFFMYMGNGESPEDC